MPNKRELVDCGTGRRYVRRDDNGRFEEVVGVGQSLARDGGEADNDASPGQGDRGDRT